MIFRYDELKEYVKEDFLRFYEMGFNEKQIVPAILNEYEHGIDFCKTENICIYVFIALNFIEKRMDTSKIIEKIEFIIKDMEVELQKELENEFKELLIDIDTLMKSKDNNK